MPQLDSVLYSIFLGSMLIFSAVILCLVTEALLLVTLLQRGRRLQGTAKTVVNQAFREGGAGFGRSSRYVSRQENSLRIILAAIKQVRLETRWNTLLLRCCASYDTVADCQ